MFEGYENESSDEFVSFDDDLSNIESEVSVDDELTETIPNYVEFESSSGERWFQSSVEANFPKTFDSFKFEPGPIGIDQSATPVAIFDKFLGRELISQICHYTNVFGNLILQSKWKNVDESEFYCYIGIWWCLQRITTTKSQQNTCGVQTEQLNRLSILPQCQGRDFHNSIVTSNLIVSQERKEF